jgi:hypothetical protein
MPKASGPCANAKRTQVPHTNVVFVTLELAEGMWILTVNENTLCAVGVPEYSPAFPTPGKPQ